MKESVFASAIRLIEEALVLTKRQHAAGWLIYFAGVVPFFSLLLFEITDIVEDPFALERLAGAAFALALLYFWMHICQSVFCSCLQATLTETEAALWLQFRNACLTQWVVAGSKLLLWPVTMALLIPHPAVTMFYQHSLVPQKAYGSDANWRYAIAESRRDARYRQGQAAWMLALVLVIRAILWINLFFLLLILPTLWKTFTGTESMLTRAPGVLLNPTSLAALCTLTYLGLDPIVKAACVLRQFARRSERSGLDLRLRLSPLKRAVVVALILVALIVPMHRAAAAQSVTAPAAISPQQMSGAIRSVFHDRHGIWDLPLAQPRKPASNAITAFLDGIVDRVDAAWQSVTSALDTALKALRDIFSNRQAEREAKKPVSRINGWLILGCFSLLLCAAILMALRNRRNRPRPGSIAAAVPTKALDISREDLHPADQTEDEWLTLANQYRAAGNLRLALRALYLYTLSALGRTGVISLARGKSNLDYLRELQRRAKRLDPGFAPAFHSNVSLFEQSWYGAHPVTEEMLALFERNSARLRESSLTT